jgi:transcriptional regulator GlxA family with amidase domain
LQAAHEHLSLPCAETTVTDVALSLGFLHLPRFAHYYRQAFDEHPSETLRAGRRRRLGPYSRRIAVRLNA